MALKSVNRKYAIVIASINEVLVEHGYTPSPNSLMDKDYGYAEPSMLLFLKSVKTKLDYNGYSFDFDDSDLDFVDSCLTLALVDLEIKVNRKTQKKGD